MTFHFLLSHKLQFYEAGKKTSEGIRVNSCYNVSKTGTIITRHYITLNMTVNNISPTLQWIMFL